MGSLTGRRVVVTRPRDRAGSLIAALEAEGAEVILFPAIEVLAPEDPRPLRDAARRLAGYDWVVFTSVYGVRALAAAGADAGSGPRVACVGEATADAAREAGWRTPLLPEASTGRDLAAALLDGGVEAGHRVLLPRAEDAREEVPALLRAAGALVDDVVAYRKRGPTAPADELRRLLHGGNVDVLTFTSPSTVRHFAGTFGRIAGNARVVVIGPTTAAAARAVGLTVAAMAAESTMAGLVEAVRRTLNSQRDR